LNFEKKLWGVKVSILSDVITKLSV